MAPKKQKKEEEEEEGELSKFEMNQQKVVEALNDIDFDTMFEDFRIIVFSDEKDPQTTEEEQDNYMIESIAKEVTRSKKQKVTAKEISRLKKEVESVQNEIKELTESGESEDSPEVTVLTRLKDSHLALIKVLEKQAPKMLNLFDALNKLCREHARVKQRLYISRRLASNALVMKSQTESKDIADNAKRRVALDNYQRDERKITYLDTISPLSKDKDDAKYELKISKAISETTKAIMDKEEVALKAEIRLIDSNRKKNKLELEKLEAEVEASTLPVLQETSETKKRNIILRVKKDNEAAKLKEERLERTIAKTLAARNKIRAGEAVGGGSSNDSSSSQPPPVFSSSTSSSSPPPPLTSKFLVITSNTPSSTTGKTLSSLREELMNTNPDYKSLLGSGNHCLQVIDSLLQMKS
jgi:hypothetical protein